MANVNITGLPNLTTMTDASLIPADDSGTTYHISGSTLKNYVNNATGNLIPAVDNVSFLGNSTNRWANIFLGPGTLYMTDANVLSNVTAELTVVNGVLLINGVNQQQVGQLKFINNTIESTTGNIPIEIGITSSSADLLLNRNTVLAAGKTLGLVDTGNTANVALLSVTNGVLNIGGINQIQAPGILNGTSNISILANSSIQMYVPTANTTIGAIAIVGTTDGNTVPPQNTGVMLHLTGQTGSPSRIYNDSVNTYAALVGRRYNGNVNVPTQVLANSIITRYAATPYTSNGWPAISTARIDMVTTEDQTDSNQGTEIQFWTTSLGSNTIAKVMSLTNNDINLAGNITTIGNATFSTNPAYVNNITVSGTAYDAQMVIDDVGASHVAQLILNRSSTSVQPILAGALNNSDDPTANVDVTNGQTLLQIASLGFAGTDFKEFASIVALVDDNGNVSDTSSPGKIDFRVTPDGSTNTNTALTITNDSTSNFYGLINVNNVILGGNTPTTAAGADGDLAGMVTFDLNYMYYCYQDFASASGGNIWARTQNTKNW